jgi:hypothetical protein
MRRTSTLWQIWYFAFPSQFVFYFLWVPTDWVGQQLTPHPQAKSILDDIMYNIIHDIVLKTHRDEKMARAASAAIVIEAKAAETDPNAGEDSSVSESNHHVETDAAIYNNGEVYLKGNPLKTITEINCPKCGKPRLLHPTDGNRARRPEPGVDYCKKHPYIEKDYHDVYGQTFQPDGPGRGKKKKDMVDPLKLQQAKASGTPNGSQDSPGTSPPSGDGPAKPIAFPHAKCHNCGTFLPIKRMNNHMAKCMGGGGRDSSRTALWKIQNGNGNGSQNGATPPPGSRNGTPAPSNLSNNKRSSPNKRDRDDEFDSDSSPQKKPKKNLIKKSATNKLKELKAPKMSKSASQQREASNLSFEEKPPGNSESEDDDGDDDGDGEYGTVTVEPKKKLKAIAVGKKVLKDKKKWMHGKGGVKPSLPPIEPPDSSSGKLVSAVASKVKNGVGAVVNGKADIGGESESSQTLSSPN